LKSKVTYRIGTILGGLTLLIGTAIFLIWWVARHWFAISLIDFEVYGFIWILIAIPIALIGLFLILFTIGNNYPKFCWKTIGSLILILANIPTLYFILEKHSDLDTRAYFKLINRSNVNDIELSMSASTFQKEIGVLNHSESTVNYFYPKYLNDRRESVRLVDTVTIIIRTPEKIIRSGLPNTYKGSCSIFMLTDDFQLECKQPTDNIR